MEAAWAKFLHPLSFFLMSFQSTNLLVGTFPGTNSDTSDCRTKNCRQNCRGEVDGPLDKFSSACALPTITQQVTVSADSYQMIHSVGEKRPEQLWSSC